MGLYQGGTLISICTAGFMFAKTIIWPLAVSLLTLLRSGDNQDPAANDLSWNSLVPDSSTMARAWEFPRNPMTDTAGLDPQSIARIRKGFLLFTNTSELARHLAGGTMTCNNCHPNGGQRDKAMPLLGVDRAFPEYNKRSGRDFTLEERIVGCFMRSLNATGSVSPFATVRHENELDGATLTAATGEVRDLAAYIRWLSWNRTVDPALPWRGHNKLPESSLLGIDKLDPKLGRRLFLEKCSNCHGEDGQGIDIGDKRPGPLWGPNSWNDGAGAARVHTLAGMIRSWMPYMNPGSLTDEEAQHIAAFITSQPRPGFPFKEKDYLKEKIPADAVYYERLYGKNPLTSR